jgi:hypothetical protein
MKRRAWLWIALFAVAVSALGAQSEEERLDLFCRHLASRIDPRPALHPDAARLNHYLDLLSRLLLADPYYQYLNVRAEDREGRVRLAGEVERAEFKEVVVRVLASLGAADDGRGIEVLPERSPGREPFGVVTAMAAPTTLEPGDDTPMDEALHGEPVYILKELAGYYLIKTFSGYWGWTEGRLIRRLDEAGFCRFVSGATITLVADWRRPDRTLPAGSRLLLERWGHGSVCRAIGPDGVHWRLPKRICRRRQPPRVIAGALLFASSLLNAPYRLGGKHRLEGIDCSGLVQLAYARVGVNLPRDARQQYMCGNLVATPWFRSGLRSGDVLFFMDPTARVVHTALYLGAGYMIHATGDHVQIQRIDPAAPDGYRLFDDYFLGAKRFFE